MVEENNDKSGQPPQVEKPEAANPSMASHPQVPSEHDDASQVVQTSIVPMFQLGNAVHPNQGLNQGPGGGLGGSFAHNQDMILDGGLQGQNDLNRSSPLLATNPAKVFDSVDDKDMEDVRASIGSKRARIEAQGQQSPAFPDQRRLFGTGKGLNFSNVSQMSGLSMLDDRPGAIPARDARTDATLLYGHDELTRVLEGWPLFKAYAKVMAENPAADSLFIFGHKGFLVEAKKLKTIVCRSCGGYGHTHRKCPTLSRLRMVAQSSDLAKTWLNQALGTVRPTRAQEGQAPILKSNVPYSKQ